MLARLFINSHYSRFKTSALIVLFFSLVNISTRLQAQPPSFEDLPQDAFTIALTEELPLDSKVITGEFDNGIRYYIRENNQPSNRASLRLAVDVGSILENDNQVGLAHFLEHMAFNGTENFEKQEIINFMESIGMRLGPGINASTSFDETIYQLQVPTDEPSNMLTAFRILEDWATALTLDADEIEAERGVVIEEWRLGQGAQSRIRDQQFPILLKDSKYAERLPIGTLENLQNFEHQELKDFYQDWYRPELMSVIAVGDFNAEEIEALMREHFESIPASANPKQRDRYDVPAHQETLFSIATDPEVPITQVVVYHKQDPDYDWTINGYRQSIVERLYNSMLSARFQELTVKPNPPFLGAASSNSNLIRPLSAYVLSAAVQETGIKQGLEGLLVEAERVARFGFTEAELERQKTALQRSRQQQYTNRDSRNSSSHASEMIRSAFTGESIPGAEYEFALTARFLAGITLDEVNQVGQNWISNNNRVVSIVAPEKDGLVMPSEDELAEVLAGIANIEITPYEEKTNDNPLLSVIPQGSEIIDTTLIEGGLTQWQLANGVKVILKPTDFTDDQILFSATSFGGTSLVSDEDFIPAETAITLIANGGLGQFNSTELQQKLTGKLANVVPSISDYQEGLSGATTQADLETLFQLIYLRMTAPRADATFYDIFNNQMRAVLPNRTANPGTQFGDKFNQLISQNHLRRQPPSIAMLDATNLEKSLNFYQDRLSDASGFTFVFVGSLDLDVMRPFVETYLGGLPTSGKEESWKDVGIRVPSGVIKETIYHGLEPKSQTQLAFTGSFNIQDNAERTRLIGMILALQGRLSDVMREELGGTYGVQVSPDMDWIPENAYQVRVSFGSAPERVNELTEIMFAEIEKLKQTGPTQKEIDDIKQTLERGYESSMEQNAFWLSQLMQAISMGSEQLTSQMLSHPQTIEALSVESVKQAFSDFLDMENYIHLTMLPEQ